MAVKYGYLEETELTDIANAIREKNGQTTVYKPSEMAAAIKAISTGDADTSDGTAESGDILTGKTAYVKGSKVTGSIQVLTAITYSPSDTAQTIESGQYLSGTQTIEAVTADNIPASIKESQTVTAPLKNSIDVTPTTGKILTGVTVNAPDMSSATVTVENLVRGVKAYDSTGSLITGTHDETTLSDMTSDATASESDLLPGKTAYANGSKITGTMSTKDAATYNPSDSDQIISGGQYLNGTQTIAAVTSSNIPSSLLESQTITAPLTGSTDVTPTTGKVLTGVTVNAADTTGTASAGDILTGKTAYVNGVQVTGTINRKYSATYNPSDTDQVISSGVYLSGNQTIAAVTADNIPTSITESQTVTASLTDSVNVTPNTGKVLTGVTVNAPDMSGADATADDILTGKKAYGSDGTLITGTNTGTSGGIDTSDATAESTDIVKGKTAYVNGTKITGVLEAVTVYTSSQVPSSTVGSAGDICIITS